MAAVAGASRSVEPGLELHREPVALPVGKAPRERDDVLVAELRERLGRKGRAVADRAVEDDGPGGIGRQPLDAGFEMAPRNMDGAGDVTLVPLVLLSDVDDDGFAGLDPVSFPPGVDLRDLGPDLLQQLS